MVFALYPHTLMSMAELSWPEILVGSKKNDPTTWRILTDLFSGKTKHPKKKTIDKLLGLMATKYGRRDELPAIYDQVGEIPDGPPWTSAIAAFNAGILASSGEPLAMLAKEAGNLESLAKAASSSIRQKDYAAAASHVREWEIGCQLPSVSHFMGQLGKSTTPDDFRKTAAPLVAVSTLYLLACLEVDFFGADVPSIQDLLPLRRGRQVIRPTTRWIEMAQSSRGLVKKREVADYLLSPRATSEDVGTLRRLVRDWRAGKKVPPKSRIPHIVSSLVKEHGEDRRAELTWKVSVSLAIVRLLERLLDMSNKIHKTLPDFDPLGPFQDYPLMRRHAEQLKRGATTVLSDSPAAS